MPFAPANGIRLYYESHGEGPTLVFAHGRGGNHLSWWQQIPAFRSDFRCITFDHREFGQSPDVPNGPGRLGFVEDLRALLDHLGIARASLVGQSMGGGTCLGFTAKYPERVEALVLADTPGGLAEEELLAEFRIRAPTLPQDAAIRALSDDFKKRDPAKAFLYAQVGGLTPPVRETFVEYLTASDGPTGKDLSQLRVPTLVLVGSDDVVITQSNAEVLRKHIPNARLEVVQGAGHSVYWEKPDEFNRLVMAFLKTNRA